MVEVSESAEEVRTLFRLDELKEWLLATECKSIALQFPDKLLEYAPEVTMEVTALL